MDKHRFRLANMMPNAWFYKLKEMTKSKPNKINTNNARAHPIPTSITRSRSRSRAHTHHNPLPNQIAPSRASYYFPSNSPLHPKALDTHFLPETPRKSTRKPRRKPISPRPIISTSSATCNSSRNSTSESDSTVLHCTCKITSSADDIIIGVGGPAIDLPPPIVTKKKTEPPPPPPQQQQQQKQTKHNNGHGGGTAANSAARLRMSLASSPRLVVAKKVRAVQRAKLQQRKSLSESMAVVKNSSDPIKDFRESMMEMVRENNLRASKDLEELLACYLSLNSNEFHDVIVKAFEEIWFDVINESVRV